MKMNKKIILATSIVFVIFIFGLIFFNSHGNEKINLKIKDIQEYSSKITQIFKKTNSYKKRLFVVDFKGDKKGSQVDNLQKTITSIIENSNQKDHVLVRLESHGGAAHVYGLGAYELLRIRNAGLKLIISVDRVAASGGYMMACVADEIIAAPFSYIGSIGVYSGVPNFSGIMDELGIVYERFTAGKYKGGVPIFAPITDNDRKHQQDFVNRIFNQFKDFVKKNRPKLDIEKIATGEIWTAQEAIKTGLVDKIYTSEELILEYKFNGYNIFEVRHIKIDTKKLVWKKLLNKIFPFF